MSETNVCQALAALTARAERLETVAQAAKAYRATDPADTEKVRVAGLVLDVALAALNETT